MIRKQRKTEQVLAVRKAVHHIKAQHAPSYIWNVFKADLQHCTPMWAPQLTNYLLLCYTSESTIHFKYTLHLCTSITFSLLELNFWQRQNAGIFCSKCGTSLPYVCLTKFIYLILICVALLFNLHVYSSHTRSDKKKDRQKDKPEIFRINRMQKNVVVEVRRHKRCHGSLVLKFKKVLAFFFV